MTEAETSSPMMTVKFSYIKSSAFRVIHVDGALGGLTPKGLMHVALYSERPAIPQVMEHDLHFDGSLSEGRNIEARTGIVRELEADLMMDIMTATSLRDWLTERIQQFEEATRPGNGGDLVQS